MTKHCELILCIIKESHEHLTAEDIYFIAKSKTNKIALATIYNNLIKLCDEGIIKKISNPFGNDFYEGNLIPHAHIICSKCRKIEDISSKEIDQYIDSLKGYHITSYDLIIHHICSKCLSNL